MRRPAARRVRNLIALPAGLLLAACTLAPSPPAGFGPPAPAQAAQPTHATPTRPAHPRTPPGYLRSRDVPLPKAVALRQTRIDALDPRIQNWEVELDLLRAGADADGDELFAIWMTGRAGEQNRTLTEIGMAHSADGGAHFERVDIQSPISEAEVPFDPVVHYDPGTRRTFVSLMEQIPPFRRQAWVARSEPGQALQFEPGRLLPTAAGENVDKGWLAAGPDPLAPAQTVVYHTSASGVRVSRDGGESWEGPVRLPSSANLLQPTVLRDGTLLVSYLGSGGQALLVRSEDGGRSYSAPLALHTFTGDINELTNPATPGSFRVPPTTMLVQGAGSRVHAVLHDITQRDGSEAGLDVLLFTSEDAGRSWSAPRNVTSEARALSDQFLPWLGVDAQGRLHLAYFDTARFPATDADPDAKVDVMYAASDDGGASWSRTRLTAEPIDSFGTRWSPLSDAPIAQFLGDYFTLAVSPHAVYVAHPVHEQGVYGMAVSRIALAGGGAPIRDPRGLSGLWYEPATSGQGFQFDWLAGDALAVAFYGHRDSGANLFLTGLRAGRFTYGESMDIALTTTTGGRFNNFDRNAIRNSPWGTLTLRFDSCSSASVRLEGADGIKQMQLVRLATAPGLPCD